MFRMKVTFLFVFVFAVFLSSCAPGAQYTLPPGITLIPGTDLPQQVASIVAGALTQTALPPTVTSLPILSTPVVSTQPVSNIPGQKIYQSSSFGILFNYPEAWYVQEVTSSQDIWGVAQPIPAILLTSFDPSNPPHKLEWTDQTVSIQFRMLPYVTVQFYKSLDAWLENARQVALANQLSIFAEERFLIANQPVVHLTLVSGSGGVIHQLLTILNGRYYEINIEAANFNLAKTVLDTVQPDSSGGLKPPDSDTPSSGVCGESQGEIVEFTLASDGPAIPRCAKVIGAQKIRLINATGADVQVNLAHFNVSIPAGSSFLFDQRVDEYLAPGVHFVNGAEVWVVANLPPPVVTVPPPIIAYSNSEVGYRLNLYSDWIINESGLTNGNKEVIFFPPYSTDPNITYLSISLDFRTLDQIINSYAQNVPDAIKEDVNFYGYPGIKYTYTYDRNEYFIPYGGKIFMIATDRPNDGAVQSILMTIRFIESSVTYEATIMENGKTFYMKIGDGLKINLDWSYEWSAISVNDTSVIDGSQGVYQARAPGSATLTAYGNPKCYSSTPPCLAPSIMYTINVIVQ